MLHEGNNDGEVVLVVANAAQLTTRQQVFLLKLDQNILGRICKETMVNGGVDGASVAVGESDKAHRATKSFEDPLVTTPFEAAVVPRDTIEHFLIDRFLIEHFRELGVQEVEDGDVRVRCQDGYGLIDVRRVHRKVFQGHLHQFYVSCIQYCNDITIDDMLSMVPE